MDQETLTHTVVLHDVADRLAALLRGSLGVGFDTGFGSGFGVADHAEAASANDTDFGPDFGPDFGSLLAGLSDTDLIAAVRDVERLRRLIDAAAVRAAHEVATRSNTQGANRQGMCAAYGYKTPRDFLRVLTKAPGAEITARLQVGAATAKLTGSAANSPAAGLTSGPANVFEDDHDGPLGSGPVLAGFPLVAEALHSGELNLAAAKSIVQGLAGLDNHEHVPVAEEELVIAATGNLPGDSNTGAAGSGGSSGSDGSANPGDSAVLLPVHADDIRTLTRGWCERLAALNAETIERQEARRYFHIGTERNGLVPINGMLLPDVAAKLGRAFDAINSPRVRKKPSFKKDSKTSMTGNRAENMNGTNRSAKQFEKLERLDEIDLQDLEDVESFEDYRTSAQRRHDALATAIGFALKNSEMPDLGGEAVSLIIQTTDHDYTNPAGDAWIENSHGDQTRVPARLARHASCTGNILKVTQTGTGKIVALETNQRIFNAKQRKAIILRDGKCLIPGCNIPSTWCEIHHVKEYAEGGKTHTDNGVTLCWFHHRNLETHGWKIRINDGVPEIMAPKWLDPTGGWRKHRPLHRPDTKQLRARI